MQKPLSVKLPVLALLALSACQTVAVPNTHVVAVAGKVSAGGLWAETNTGRTGELSLSELVDFLEPQEQRECVPKGHWDAKEPTLWVADFNICAEDQTTGKKLVLPARGGAIMQPAEDWNKLKTALELACRALGKHCTYDMKLAIGTLDAALVKLKQ